METEVVPVSVGGSLMSVTVIVTSMVSSIAVEGLPSAALPSWTSTVTS